MKASYEKECIKDGFIVLELETNEDGFQFASNIPTAVSSANIELQDIAERLVENIDTVKKLTPECDKTDYILAATSGAICGIIDIFLVGKPGESPIGDVTDKWFEDRTKDFAKFCGWNEKDNDSLSSAIKYLERKFKIPYDQRGAGDAASVIFDLNPKNHHFKSFAHNPTLLGLFFSVLDQFGNTSHFLSGGELISLQQADGKFELRGNNIPGKLFCAFVNWFGHLISDMSGSSSSKGRGMGIPSPLWSWTNDIIAIKKKLNISVLEFDQSLNELAIQIYKEGYDVRFQSAQAIPVFINEMLVRMMYSIRRLIGFFINTKKEEHSFVGLWKSCEPFSNATVKRMLTVAHGTFCLMDAGDAAAHGFASGGGFNVAEFFMRFNIVGVGRFTISLYGEVKRGSKRAATQKEVYFLKRERIIINDYIEGLKDLSDIYDDGDLLTFVEDLKCSDMYKQAFEKTIILAEKRNVPGDEILKSKADVDAYFMGVNT
ncbi:hypothetical protein NE619_11610 [Anaerovorax odorimutans]|uniref:Uncharacterized protein n=1 Tax=Anaerovorax odorimutans TaxID=109327 RepID=A0ABT1RQ95_9FIRM|nr:hypothetical protein [Anaerovorax odorimutans]MCQ4637371.1 hypothetical protein [Anaerovorax odorimutans]